LHQTPGIGETTDFEFIKRSYFLSPHMKALFGNTFSLLPKGPDLSGWQQAHNRARLS
jgi:putative glutathione S-transferase